MVNCGLLVQLVSLVLGQGQSFLGRLLRALGCTHEPFSPGSFPLLNYTMIQILAIKWACEEWRHWLEGDKFRVVVYADHKILLYVESAKILNPGQARWVLSFLRFNLLVTRFLEPKSRCPIMQFPSGACRDGGTVSHYSS